MKSSYRQVAVVKRCGSVRPLLMSKTIAAACSVLLSSTAVFAGEPAPAAKTDEPSATPTVPAAKEEAKTRSSTPSGFTDDLDAAFAKAKADGKLVYACFSGSDWCGWCIKLEKEVLSKEEFLSGVTNDYVLAFIDSPRDKSVLSEHAKSANPALVKKYKIRGFPTALIFNGEGREVGKTGYRKGGPVEYVKYLKSIKEAPKAEK